MRIQRRTNILWGVILLALAVVLLLRTLGTFPAGLDDLITRAWPGLLVLVGLVLLLRGRVALGGLLAILLSGGLIAGVAYAAFSIREGEQRDDQIVEITEPIAEDAGLLALNFTVLQTEIDIRAGEGSTLTGEFVGSAESEITFECDSAANVTECTLVETKSDEFPVLEDVGRGTLTLRVPPETPLALAFSGEAGSATFDLSSTELERVSLELDAGDMLLTLPDYAPQSPSSLERSGEIIVRNGDLSVLVPPSANMRLSFDRRGGDVAPEIDSLYIEQRDSVDGLLRRDSEDGEFDLLYDAVVPNGLIRLDVAGRE